MEDSPINLSKSDFFQQSAYLQAKENEEKEKELPSINNKENNESGTNVTTNNICNEVKLNVIPFEEMKKIYNDISQILYKSSFIYNINKGTIEIKYENNTKDYDKFVEIFRQYKKKLYELFNNFSNLLNYLDKVKENCEKEFDNNLKLEIKMDLYRYELSNINKYIYNINYDYKINKHYKNDIYTDTNILENGEPKFIKYLIQRIYESVKIKNNLNDISNEHDKRLKEIERLKYDYKNRELESRLYGLEDIKENKQQEEVHKKHLEMESQCLADNTDLMERFQTKASYFEERKMLGFEVRLKELEMRSVIDEYKFINLKDELIDFYDKLSSNEYNKIERNEPLSILKITKILKESSIILDINDKGREGQNLYIFKDYSLLEDNNVNYNEFKKVLENEKNKNIDNDVNLQLIKNYKKLILFIEEIEKRLKNEIREKKIKIKLKFKENEEKEQQNLIKNISCEYILIEPLFIQLSKNNYQDNNILTLKKYTNFDLFLKELIRNIKKVDLSSCQKVKMEDEKKLLEMGKIKLFEEMKDINKSNEKITGPKPNDLILSELKKNQNYINYDNYKSNDHNECLYNSNVKKNENLCEKLIQSS